MAEHQPAFGRSSSSARTRAAEAPRGLWHRPEWMNPLADAVLLAASVALGYALVKVLLALPIFGFREVLVTSPLSQVTTAQLEFAARSSLRGNFFNLKLDDARAAFEKLPWVRHAEVRRVWPATLEVKLEEHVAVAYWKSGDNADMRLVNQYGEVFTAASNAAMPVFSGPEGSASIVLQRYKEFSEDVAPLKLRVSAVSLSPREAWQLHLSDGLTVELGRDQAQVSLAERLSRFVSAWPETRLKMARAPVVADLRYPSGFAVRVADAPASGKGKQ